eukprot:CAMPEP_0195080944 /NCGR_PEP_ID=MMETSP0448-20130528/22523_1 /TAXON_ID=66468 /ORGANISM="Heterocapsa triquestra, Strain CCMP 448" /LENGTH=55 /DNA_ID=CAMNT_0040113935 /DNA_START=98 /DNA_END=261 /DNA_ORIENTATION=+
MSAVFHQAAYCIRPASPTAIDCEGVQNMSSLVAGQLQHSEDVSVARPDGGTYRDA